MPRRHIKSRIKLASRAHLVSNTDPAQRVLPRSSPKYVKNEPAPMKRSKKSYIK